MAISSEDKKDVKTHLGKALAEKVGDATTDYKGKLRRVAKDKKAGKVAYLRPASDTKKAGYTQPDSKGSKMKPFYKYSDVLKQAGQKSAAKEEAGYEKGKGHKAATLSARAAKDTKSDVKQIAKREKNFVKKGESFND